MKALIEFDMTNFPRFLDGKTFRNREEYSKYLIVNGYAYDPFMPEDPKIDVVNAEVEETLPLLSDTPEESAKKRGRKKKIEGEA